jgi:hypothetical protein
MPTTVIYVNGAISTLASITPGAYLSMELAADGTTVVAMGTSTTSH